LRYYFRENFDEGQLNVLIETIAEAQRESNTFRYGYATVEVDEVKRGKLAIDIYTPLGEIERFEAVPSRVSDVQSGQLDEFSIQPPLIEPRQSSPTSLSTSVLWSTVRDSTTSASQRADALRMLFETEQESAVGYVADQICREDLSEEWQSALVFFAEDSHFPFHLRQEICDRLLAIALSMRESTKVGSEKVVWSALRRAASLIPREHANKLLPFLLSKSPVDTRSVALKCVERVFEAAPPAKPEECAEISSRVQTFAFKFLDPDIFAGGENALIAQNAVCAMAALGDERLSDAFACVNSLNRRWLRRQIRFRLVALLESWTGRDPECSARQPFKNIQENLPLLD